MNVLDLPVEIGILIYKYLDTKSKINVYESCNALRVFFAPCHLRKLVFSRSSVATAKVLNREFFLNLGEYVQHLDVCGVSDLNANDFRPHVERLANLKYLDVTFTNIYLPDIVDICPKNLKEICINFFKCPRRSKRDDIWEQCQLLFKQRQFVNVHFVVFELLDSDSPLLFLEGLSPISNLKITVADTYKDFWEVEDEDVSLESSQKLDINFSRLFYLFRDCRVTHKTSRCLKGVSNLDFSQLEYLFIMYLEKIVIYVSPVFRNLFLLNCSDLKVEMCSYLPLDFILDGNIVFKAWSKTTTIFDEKFFESLLEEIKDYFPSYVCMHNQIKMKVTKAPSDWYCIDACDGFENILDDLPSKVTLTDFCRKDGAVVRCNRPIPLSSESKTLHNITFIRLSNICVKEDFFTVLFTECEKLYTLDIYVEKRGRLGIFRGCTLLLSRSIHFAKSLQNVKLTSEDIEYEILFGALSRCPTLENVHICEYERALADEEISVENILLFIEKCENLYSLFIEADMSPEMLTLLMSPLREKSQNLNRDHLCIEVCDCYRGWNPFVDVFNPSPLHILD